MKKNMLKTGKLLILSLFVMFSTNLTAQVAINDDGTAPNSNTMLDINFSGTNIKGLLIPRMTTAERTGTFDDAFAGTEEGLTVYDTDLHSFYYYNGTAWKELTTQGANWSITGNAGIAPSTDFLGTTDAQPLIFSTNGTERARFLSGGNFGIGTVTPDVFFHIFGDDTDLARPNDDATYSNTTGLFVIGDITGRNLVIDQNEILARNNEAASSLYLQNRGGDIRIHYDRPTTTHDDGSQVIIKDDGKVGIGFLAPLDMLHIYAPLPYIRFTDDDGGHSWNAGVYGNTDFQRFQISEYSDPTTYRQRLVIKEGGNVGIGTVSPEGILHIKADAGNNATFVIDADAGTDGTDTWEIRNYDSDNDLIFRNNDISRMT
ncbi:MAG: hypothetical protein U9N34_09970, partial [Candidatus Cloacimonadota bacterium]|nr:hypothetical protein [Candidatus Cloacimonadota bacterium]